MDTNLEFIINLLTKIYIGICFIFGFWYITLHIIYGISKKISKYFKSKPH